MGTSSSTVATATDRPRTRLPADTIVRLHDAVSKYEWSAYVSPTHQHSLPRERELCVVLQQLCDEAITIGLGPETVVIALKQAYLTVPRRLLDGVPIVTRYEAVFRMCLRCYFPVVS